MTSFDALDEAINWLTGWHEALAEARATRRPVLIDVWKDP